MYNLDYNIKDIQFEVDNEGTVRMIIIDSDNSDSRGIPVFREIDAVSLDDYLKLTGGYGESDKPIVIKTHNALKNELAEKVIELRAHGISDEEMFKSISDSTDTERIFINRNFRIFLRDRNMSEIKLSPLAKTIYFFLLRHPEGVAIKEIYDHREEIGKIYKKVFNKDSNEVADAIIARLTYPYSESANEQMSRIRTAFRNKVPASAIDKYAPSKGRGDRKVIKIDRNLIEWEKPLDL